MKGMETMTKMEKMKPSMHVESTDVENLDDYQPGDKVKMEMMGTMMSKRMMKDGKCEAEMEMSDISMHDEDSKKADKMGLSRKDYKEVMKGRKKGGE